MSLIIHLGSWKSGSTLIQQNLRTNNKQLQKAGVRFIDQGEKQFLEFLPFYRKAINAIKGNVPQTDEIVTASAEKFWELGNPDKHNAVVHSWEVFLGHPFNTSKNQMYHAEATAAWFERILGQHKPLFVIYLRRQADFIEAMYNQEVSKGRFLGSIEDFLEEFCQRSLSWRPTVEPFVSRFGLDNVKVIPFEVVKRDPEKFVDDFVDLFLNEKLEKKLLHSNPSLSEKATKIALAAYPHLEQNERVLLEKFLRTNFSNKTHGRCDFLGPLRRAYIFESTQEENRRLFEDFIPSFDPTEFGYC